MAKGSTIQLDVEVVKISGPFSSQLVKNRKGRNFNRVEMLEERSQAGFDYLMRDMGNEMKQIFKVFDSNVKAQVENLKISESVETEDPLHKPQVTESRVPRSGHECCRLDLCRSILGG